jgi:hypothetical protein
MALLGGARSNGGRLRRSACHSFEPSQLTARGTRRGRDMKTSPVRITGHRGRTMRPARPGARGVADSTIGLKENPLMYKGSRRPSAGFCVPRGERPSARSRAWGHVARDGRRPFHPARTQHVGIGQTPCGLDGSADDRPRPDAARAAGADRGAYPARARRRDSGHDTPPAQVAEPATRLPQSTT